MQVGAVVGRMQSIDLRLTTSLSTQPASFHFHVRCNLQHNSDNLKSISQNGRMFILGMGFLGQFFGTDLKSKGWTVSGTCTSVAKKKKFEEMGFDAYVFDAKDPSQYPVFHLNDTESLSKTGHHIAELIEFVTLHVSVLKSLISSNATRTSLYPFLL